MAKSKTKPKYGEYKCSYCEAHIEGAFLSADTVYCYLCGKQMKVKDMVKILKPKEIKSTVEPDLYRADPLSYEFHIEYNYGNYIVIDGHGKVRKDLMGL